MSYPSDDTFEAARQHRAPPSHGVQVDTTAHDQHIATGGNPRTAPGFVISMPVGVAPLSFAELRAANERRLPQFKNRLGEPAHSEPDGSDWSDAEWLQALPMMRDELADVVCYLDLLAFRLGIDLGEAVRDKFNRVSERVGSDVKL